MLGRSATFFYGAALVTLPWAGIGLLKILTGRDWGGGLQPSWFFLALAMICLTLDKLQAGTLKADLSSSLPASVRRWWLIGVAGIFLSILLSLGGLWLAPSGESLGGVMGRFGKQTAQLIIMMCFTAWPALWTRGRRRWSWTIRMLLIGGLIQFAYGMVQGVDYYAGLPGFAWLDGVCTSNPSIFSGSGELYLGDAFRNVPRLRGTACEPLYLGNYLLFLLPLTLVPVWSARKRRLIASVLLVLLLGTWSRGAWLGLVIQVVAGSVLVFGCGRRSGEDSTLWSFRRWKFRLGIVVIMLVMIPVAGWVAGWESLMFPYRRLAQTFSSQDWSNLTRLYSMQAAWRAFLLSPVVGIGWGQFGWHFPLLVDPMGLQSQFTWPVVNNYPLLVLCETGLVGFGVFAAWWMGLVRACHSSWKRLCRLVRDQAEFLPVLWILVGVSLSTLGVWSQMLTFSQYNLPHIWVAPGLVLAIIADPGRREPFPGDHDSEEKEI